MVKLFFLGRDERSKHLKKLYGMEDRVQIVDNIQAANFVIFPIPFTKDKIYITGTDYIIEDVIKECTNKTIFSGGVPKEHIRQLEVNNVVCYDLMQLDEIAYLNAIPTAEGAIAKAMELTQETIHGSNILVLGFGRVAKILADKLKGLNANVFCAARSKKDLAHIKALGYNVIDINSVEECLNSFSVIFNTVPTIILGEKKLVKLNKDVLIVDLASSPGGVDYPKAKELGINAVLELGIPSKVAPKSAAKYLKEYIDKIIYS